MLCFNEPTAPNLPPLFPSHPRPWAVFYRPLKQPTPPPLPPPPLHGPPRWQPRLPLRRLATTTGPESLDSSPLLVQKSLRRLAPTCPAAEPLPARLPGRRAPSGHADPQPPDPYRPGGEVPVPG